MCCELEEAWRIFTPVLHDLEQKQVRPIIYPYGSRGPPEADKWIEELGYERGERQDYQWPKQSVLKK